MAFGVTSSMTMTSIVKRYLKYPLSDPFSHGVTETSVETAMHVYVSASSNGVRSTVVFSPVFKEKFDTWLFVRSEQHI